MIEDVLASMRDLNEKIELAKIYFDKFESRRGYQWKINLSFWLGIAAFTYYFTGQFKVDNTLIILYLYVFINYVIWSVGLQSRQQKDGKSLAYWLKIIEEENGKNEFKEPSWFGKYWSWISEISFTFILLFLSIYALFKTYKC